MGIEILKKRVEYDKNRKKKSYSRYMCRRSPRPDSLTPVSFCSLNHSSAYSSRHLCPLPFTLSLSAHQPLPFISSLPPHPFFLSLSLPTAIDFRHPLTALCTPTAATPTASKSITAAWFSSILASAADTFPSLMFARRAFDAAWDW